MGYYSDIDLTMDRKAFSKLQKLAEKDEDVKEMLTYDSAIDDKSDFPSISWGSVKWIGYEDDDHFPGVNKLEKFLSKLPRESYYFHAVGEDGDVWRKGLLFENPAAKLENPLEDVINGMIKDYGEAKTRQLLQSALPNHMEDSAGNEKNIVENLSPAQLLEAYRIQEFNFRVEDAKRTANLMYDSIPFTENDYETMASVFMHDYDCNMSENDLWSLVVEEHVASNYPQHKEGPQ